MSTAISTAHAHPGAWSGRRTSEIPRQEIGSGRRPSLNRVIDHQCTVAALEMLAAVLKAGHLLELGCGLGRFTAAAATHGYTIDAVERVEAVAKVARDRVGSLTGVTIHCADTERPGFDASTFDAVAALRILSWASDPSGVLREIQRVLRPGGYLIAVVRNQDMVSGLVRRARSRGRSRAFLPHMKSRREWGAIIKAAGFEILRERRIGLNSPTLFGRHVIPSPLAVGIEGALFRWVANGGTWIPFWGTHLVVLARNVRECATPRKVDG